MRKGDFPLFLIFSSPEPQTRPASERPGPLPLACPAPPFFTRIARGLLLGEYKPVSSHAAGVRVIIVVEARAACCLGEDTVRHELDKEASHTSVGRVDGRVL